MKTVRILCFRIQDLNVKIRQHIRIQHETRHKYAPLVLSRLGWYASGTHPLCSVSLVHADLPMSLICSHVKSQLYYEEALREPTCTFWGIKDDVYKRLLR
jgi:hypothetical protein